MSTVKVKVDRNRKYVLNVARQFLQRRSCNPLNDREHFIGVARHADGHQGPHGFYRYYCREIREFLIGGYGFTAERLGRIVSAGISGQGVTPGSKPLGSTMFNIYREQIPWWHDQGGMDMLLGFAGIVIAGAAYDLCLAKHG